MNIVALIPARAGSKRLPGKNIKPLAGHPLIAYTIAAAKQAGIFTDVIVSSEDPRTLQIAGEYGATQCPRDSAFAQDDSPDIQWVSEVMQGRTEDAFAILRPTSPFRGPGMIPAAWELFQNDDADSMRTVRVWQGQHPAKMWGFGEPMRMIPVVRGWTDRAPFHSAPTQSLPKVFAQTGGMEMARSRVLRADRPTISGDAVFPYLVGGLSALDINSELEWAFAEEHAAELPTL